MQPAADYGPSRLDRFASLLAAVVIELTIGAHEPLGNPIPPWPRHLRDMR
jgi:hypothetical protein